MEIRVTPSNRRKNSALCWDSLPSKSLKSKNFNTQRWWKINHISKIAIIPSWYHVKPREKTNKRLPHQAMYLPKILIFCPLPKVSFMLERNKLLPWEISVQGHLQEPLITSLVSHPMDPIYAFDYWMPKRGLWRSLLMTTKYSISLMFKQMQLISFFLMTHWIEVTTFS